MLQLQIADCTYRSDLYYSRDLQWCTAGARSSSLPFHSSSPFTQCLWAQITIDTRYTSIRSGACLVLLALCHFNGPNNDVDNDFKGNLNLNFTLAVAHCQWRTKRTKPQQPQTPSHLLARALIAILSEFARPQSQSSDNLLMQMTQSI